MREFAAFLGRSPDRAEPEDLRRYQLHLASRGASYARMNLSNTTQRFFFHVTLGRAGSCDRMARLPTPERLPVVLSVEEDLAKRHGLSRDGLETGGFVTRIQTRLPSRRGQSSVVMKIE